jgi:hypothetical protein
MRPPLFEVTLAAPNAAARRLTTKENVKAALRITTDGDDSLIEQYIDRVSASAAKYCKLASAVGTVAPTFGTETLRATWFVENGGAYRGDTLVLPWRAPFAAISSVVEGGTTLTEGDDYELLQGGLLLRLDAVTQAPKLWSSSQIVVAYTAGWSLPDGVPPDLEGPVIEQVKLAYLASDRDPGIRAETIPDLEQVEYSVPGGATIGRSGLLAPLEEALSPFKDWSQG